MRAGRTVVAAQGRRREWPGPPPSLMQQKFHDLLRQLTDWHSDSVRAQAYDTSGAGAAAPGHAVLRRNNFPGEQEYRRRWAAMQKMDGPAQIEERIAIFNDLEAEIYGLSHGPSRVGPASGLHRGTAEWRLAIAESDGSLRAVARRFGVSHTEVRRLRASRGR
jgi:hypothetical protein